jgi:hypothetical protein
MERHWNLTTRHPTQIACNGVPGYTNILEKPLKANKLNSKTLYKGKSMESQWKVNQT